MKFMKKVGYMCFKVHIAGVGNYFLVLGEEFFSCQLFSANSRPKNPSSSLFIKIGIHHFHSYKKPHPTFLRMV